MLGELKVRREGTRLTALDPINPNKIRLKGVNELANIALGQNHLAANEKLLRVKGGMVFRKVRRGMTLAGDGPVGFVVKKAIELILSAADAFQGSEECCSDFCTLVVNHGR
jgi:hypothetical protein